MDETLLLEDECEMQRYATATESAAIKTLLTRLATLRGELAAAKERERWIPVSDKVPDLNGKYLLATVDGGIYTGVWCPPIKGERPIGIWAFHQASKPISHWRPLPVPPPEENKHD